ncbi:MAG: hypothetical protein SX243_16340, partial [Acidobacteriota bacterium]|nr:hypothetical protein [Acidobacteriota bacterium]
MAAPGVRGDVQHPTQERGFSPERAYQQEDLDSINLFNGNLTVTIPIGQAYQGNGSLSYSLNLVYNSNVWDWSYVKKIGDVNRYPGALASADSNAGLGWRLSLGELLPPLTGRNEGDLTAYRNETQHWSYLDASGSDHLFYSTPPNGGGSQAGVWYTRDSTYLRLRQVGSWMELDFPNGHVHRFWSDGRLHSIRDPWGNTLNILRGTNLWTLDDGIRQHKVHFQNFNYDGRQVPMVTRVQVAQFGGGFADYDFSYANAQVERPVGHDPRTRDWPCIWDNSRSCAPVPLLTAISRPDGTEYRMNWADYHTRRETVTLPYDQDQSGQLDTYYIASPGVIHRMRLPTRGYLEWDYRGYRFPNGWEFDPQDRQRPDFWSESQGVAARRLLNYNQDSMGGEWWYQPEYRFTQEVIGGVTREVPQEILTTVIDPHGTATDNYFNAQFETWSYGLPFTDHQPTHSSHNRLRYLSQVIRPAPGVRGNVRKVHLEYEHDSCLGRLDQGQYDCQRRVKSERMDFGAGFFRLTNRATFDGFGNYDWSVKISNYRDSGDERHETYRDHRKVLPNSGQAWILGTYSRSSERENYYNGSPGTYFKFETEHCFDLATGAELRTRRKKSAGLFNNRDVVQVSTYNSQGNVVGEHWYGGDTQSVSLSSNLCSMALPSSAVHGRTHTYQNGTLASTKIDGLNYFPYRGTVDASTGLLQESQQANGFSTAFNYDALGRIQLVTPQEGSKTEYYYENASGNQLAALAKVYVYQRAGGSSNVILNRQEYHYDSIGRLWQERRQVPNAGWIRKQTHYLNALGWKSAESTWFSSSEYPAGWTRYHEYDAYGRAWAIQAPDAQTSSDFHMTRFTYGGERYAQRRSYVADYLKADDTVGETKYFYETFRDGQGRIWKIKEPAGGLTATYDYDAAGNLTHARLDSASGVVQHRYWTYDGRGFMTREIHPENGTYHFESIDARGKALRKRHDSGLRDLAFEYDAAERMTGVRDRKLSGWPYLKSFEYAGSGDAGTWGFGKLWKATRTNIRRIPWAPSITTELDVRETYTYNGVGGRISRRVTDLNNSDRVFDQSWTYDDLGNVKTQGYPRCTDAPCNTQPGPARNLTRDYVYGQLTAVREGSTTLGSLTYHDNGSLASVLHANQIRDEIDQDPWNRSLPRNFRTVFQDGSSVELGVHHYDGSGNLKERRKTIAGCTAGAVCQDYYLYDAMNRLRHFHDGSGALEAYGYDAFGNMTWVDWTDTGLSPLRRNLPVISSSNRSGMGSYDAVGNLTSRLMGSGSEIYEFDALDMIASRNFPEETFVYTADDERIQILRWQAGQPTDEEYTLRDLDGKVLTIYDLEVDSAEHWSWRKDFVYRGSALLMSMADQPWPTHRQHFSLDHLGSPRLITAHNGTPLEDHHYMGFGRELGAFAGNENLEQRFTGHRRDHNAPGEADDLDYMHAR